MRKLEQLKDEFSKAEQQLMQFKGKYDTAKEKVKGKNEMIKNMGDEIERVKTLLEEGEKQKREAERRLNGASETV